MLTDPLRPGSVLHTVLVYTVSESGEWTAESIADDIDGIALDDIVCAVRALSTAGLVHVNSTDARLWPLRAGREALAAAS